MSAGLIVPPAYAELLEVERDEILLGLFELRTNRQEETALPSAQPAE